MAKLGPVVLEGTHLRLEPLRSVHAEGLLQAGQAAPIWAWMSARLTAPEAVEKFIAAALQAENAGLEYVFAVVRKDGGRIVGSTRFMDVQAAHGGVEVGWTWYAPGARRSTRRPSCCCSGTPSRSGAPVGCS